jgi:hypothetical protein
MPARTEEENNKFVEYIASLFRDSYNEAYPYLKRASNIQKAFDCQIEDEEWGTVSEVFFPILRSAVMYVLPYVFQYLFPKDSFLELIPETETMSFDTVKRIETFLEDLLIWKMKIRNDGLLTLQDALKFGCGYGIVEKQIITPPSTKTATAISGGSKVDAKTVMISGEPKEVVSYRYVPYQQIIPTQDGDRPDDVSCTFFLDFIRSDTFERMYMADAAKPKEQRVYLGNPEEIIKNTKERKIDGSVYHMWWIMANIGHKSDIINKYKNLNEISYRASSEYGPVRIPILKCYFKNHHVWLANGDTIIYEEYGSFETLRSPIIKATATPDSGNWYANSDVSASQDVAEGISIFKNSILDLLTYWLHPTTLYNQDMLADSSRVPDTGAFGSVAVYGVDDVERAVKHMQGPVIPPFVQNFGVQMEQDMAHATGRSQALETSSLGGLTRAGSGATESLLQNMSARQELIAGVFQMNWLEDVVLNTLAMIQTMNTPKLSTTIRDSEKQEFKQLSITQEEVRHIFEARISFEGDNRSANDKIVDIQLYQLMVKDNPYFNQIAPVADIIGRKKADRWSATPEEIERNIQIKQQQAAQAAQMTRGQQAVAGGAAQRNGAR